MKDFFAHPFWSFLGTAAAILTFWIDNQRRKGTLKISGDVKRTLKQIGGWTSAILSVFAFILGNIVGQSGILAVFGELNSKFINVLTGVVTFFIAIVFILIGNKIKTWVMK